MRNYANQVWIHLMTFKSFTSFFAPTSTLSSFPSKSRAASPQNALLSTEKLPYPRIGLHTNWLEITELMQLLLCASYPHFLLEPWHKLDDKVVLVTGASSGLGRDFCLDLAKAGCRIVAAARRLDRLHSLCQQINNSSGDGGLRAVAVELDVSADVATIDKSVQKAWDAFGRIDTLINNAGVRGNVKSPLELSLEEWNQVFKTNLTGTWLVSKYVCKRMRDAQQMGSIINISSIAGTERGQSPGATAYACSKAGVNMLTKVMALELGASKIRVNSISPGIFKSEITEKLMEKVWLCNVAKKTVPLRQFGTSDPALTSLVRYLVHNTSEYVSGNIFITDAGATLPGVPIYSSI